MGELEAGSEWKNVWEGAEGIGRIAAYLSAIRLVERLLGQSPHEWVKVLFEAYSELFYQPVDMTFGQIAAVFGYKLPLLAKDAIIFYILFAGIFYRSVSGEGFRRFDPATKNGQRSKLQRDWRFTLQFALFWPLSLLLIPVLWLVFSPFKEEQDGYFFMMLSLAYETVMVSIIVGVACIATAVGVL
jgi:hypothetical protein